MAKSKEECRAALVRATKYGNLSATELTKLTAGEIEEYHAELSRFWTSGSDDASRDAAQVEYLTKLASDLGSAV